MAAHSRWRRNRETCRHLDALSLRAVRGLSRTRHRRQQRTDPGDALSTDALDDLGKGDNEDLNSYRKWAGSVPPRQQFQHDLVPIVYPGEHY